MNAFDAEVSHILESLAKDLGGSPASFEVASHVRRATWSGERFLVPRSAQEHHERFGVVPTALVRDLAYEAKKRELSGRRPEPSHVEADAMAYSERFLRSVRE